MLNSECTKRKWVNRSVLMQCINRAVFARQIGVCCVCGARARSCSRCNVCPLFACNLAYTRWNTRWRYWMPPEMRVCTANRGYIVFVAQEPALAPDAVHFQIVVHAVHLRRAICVRTNIYILLFSNSNSNSNSNRYLLGPLTRSCVRAFTWRAQGQFHSLIKTST